MIESLPAVATSAVCGMSSMASLPKALPSATPLESSRADAVRRREAVADEQDHVLCLARPCLIDVPADLTRVHAIGRAHLIKTWLGQGDVAKQQGRLILAIFALDEGGPSPERHRM